MAMVKIETLDRIRLEGTSPALIALDGDSPAVYSYDRLGAMVAVRTHALAAAGVGAGDSVVLCGPGGVDWIVGCLAVIRRGGCAVPVDAQFTADRFQHILEDSGARLVLAAPTAAKRFADACEAAGVPLAPLAADEDEAGEGSAQQRPAPSSDPHPDPDARAILFYTSGTTGPPKGVPLSHRNVAYQFRVLANADLVGPDERLLLPLPLHHVYPLVIGVLCPLALGLTVVLPDGFTGARILAAIREGRATMIIGVPRLYTALVEGLERQVTARGRIAAAIYRATLGVLLALRRRLGLRLGKTVLRPLHRRVGTQLRTMVSGGAALKPELAWTLEAVGWRVATGYGLTETSPLLTILKPDELRFETAGRPVAETELRIEGGDNTAAAPGEVMARGPGVFGGYLGLPDKTAAALTEDGWYHTDDLGWIDDDGFLHLAGRASTLIVTEGGENVQPEDVEEEYQSAPAIAEIAVFQTDGDIVGLIVPDKDLQDPQAAEEAVGKAVREVSRRLPSYQRLASFRLTGEALPRTRLGKIERHRVADRYDRAGKEAAGTMAAEGAVPVDVDELSDADRALLEDDAANDAFQLLVERYPDVRVTPDSDLRLDLGIDSIDWLNLTLELSERTGIALSEEAIARMHTVRDLLTGLAEGDAAGGRTLDEILDDPVSALDDRQRRWLAPPGAGTRRMGRVLAAVNRAVMRVLFRVEVKGLENLPQHPPYLLAPNHLSYLDPFVIAAALPTETLAGLHWAGWQGVLFNSAMRRAFARAAGVFPVDPDRATASSLAFGAALLKRDQALVWFPEGARSPDGRLQPFAQGLGLLLDRWRVPVVPVVLRGTFEAWPRSRRLPRLKAVSVEFMPAVDVDALAKEGDGDSEGRRITDALRCRIAAALDER